jgi:hypothetical protein
MNIYIQIISDLSQKNKYFSWWQSMIERGIQRASTREEAKSLLGYVEGHHIVPVSFNLGGKNDSDNFVYLTAKEHIMIHRLMCKFLTNEYRIKSLRAFHCMCFKDNGGQNKRLASLHQLAKAREAVSESNKGKRGPIGVPAWFTESTDFDIFCDRLGELVAEGLSDPQIGKKYDVSATAIFNWRNKLNLRRRRWQLRDKKWLHNHYVNKKLSAEKIASLIGCSGTAVQQYLIKFNIPIRDANERQKSRTDRKILTSNVVTNCQQG